MCVNVRLHRGAQFVGKPETRSWRQVWADAQTKLCLALGWQQQYPSLPLHRSWLLQWRTEEFHMQRKHLWCDAEGLAWTLRSARTIVFLRERTVDICLACLDISGRRPYIVDNTPSSIMDSLPDKKMSNIQMTTWHGCAHQDAFGVVGGLESFNAVGQRVAF